MRKTKAKAAAPTAVLTPLPAMDALDIPVFLQRGKKNEKPKWLAKPPKPYVAPPTAENVVKSRDVEIAAEVKREREERKANRAKRRADVRKATPRDLTGLRWDSLKNRFVVDGPVDLEKAIRKLTPEEQLKLHNELVIDLHMAGNKSAEPLTKKAAKALDLVKACLVLWGAKAAATVGLVVKTKGKGAIKPPRAPRPPGAVKREPKKVIPEAAKIRILMKPNPHNPNSGNRFENYNLAAKCKTYGEYLKKKGDPAAFERMVRHGSLTAE